MKKKFVCTVCGYVHEGETAPEKCPLCKAPAAKFKAAMTPQSHNTCGRGLLMMPKPMPAIEANKPSRNISDRVKDIDKYKILTGDNRLVCGAGVQIVSG